MNLTLGTKIKIYLSNFRRIKGSFRSEAFGILARLEQLRLKRVGAFARQHSGSFKDFLDSLGIEFNPKKQKRLENSFVKYNKTLADYKLCQDVWDRIFFKSQTTACSNGDLIKIEKKRIRLSEQILQPFEVFAQLSMEEKIPFLRFDTDSLEEFFLNWSKEISDPDKLYDALVKKTQVEESKRMSISGNNVYYIKYRSPASSMFDYVYAKIFEPSNVQSYKTIIISTGWSTANDQEELWQGFDKLCEKIAAGGVRAVLMESPWQGRRTPLGFYSGEQLLSNVPSSLMQLLSSQALEIASAIEWARSQKSSRKIVLVGLSMGAYVAVQLVGKCKLWDFAYWPDSVVFSEITSLVERTLVGTKFTKRIGLTPALEQMKWTKESLMGIRQMFDPPLKPSLPSSNIYTFIANKDTLGFQNYTTKLASKWRIPNENIIKTNTNHINLTEKLLKDGLLEELLFKIIQ